MLESGIEGDQRITLGPPPLEGLLDGSIWYVLPVPGDDDRRTPLQAFSFGVTEVSSFLRSLAWLPASVWELGFSWAQKAELIQDGLLGFNVVPVNVAHLGVFNVAEHSPFCVVLSSEPTDGAVSEWIRACDAKPLHVTTAAAGGDVTNGKLDEEALRAFVRARLDALEKSARYASAARAMRVHMRPPEPRTTLDFHSTSHNSCVPNELLLFRLGYEFLGDTRLNPGQGDGPVIAAIEQEVGKILSLREPGAATPSVVLASVGRSRLMEKGLLEHIKTAPKGSAEVFATAVRDFRHQTGYFGKTDRELLMRPEYQAVMQLRARELHTFTDALAVRSMSEASAFLRVPPAVDRVWGTLTKLADCHRGRSDKRATKLAKLMKQLRAELAQSVPRQLLPVLERASTGVRIVSDLPMEWTPMTTGESLLFRHACSRIPTTPGNLMIQTALPKPRIHLEADELRQLLVIRTLSEEDPIRNMAAAGMRVLDEEEGTKVTIVDVNSLSELVDALNGFDGACVVFDGHGAKTHDASGIYVGGKLVDPWLLRGVARVPPIAFPLACDTQPVDSQHSSAAAAFLAAGARTAVGSLLPINAMKSSAFLMRLVRAIHSFLPILLENGVSRVTWAELFSVIQQSQLIHETAMTMGEPRWRLDRDAITEATAASSARVFVRDRGWYGHFTEKFGALLGLSSEAFQLWMQTQLPLPDCELFVQLGDPESIVVHLGGLEDEWSELSELAAAQGRAAAAQGPPSGTCSSQTPKPPAFAGGSGVEAPGIEQRRIRAMLGNLRTNSANWGNRRSEILLGDRRSRRGICRVATE